MDAPKATETPVAAAAADRISRFRASLFPYLGKSSKFMFKTKFHILLTKRNSFSFI
jgi:hypothetical protein